MKITCNECQKSYQLPDDRLPHGKCVSFPCPSCKNRIELDLRVEAQPKQVQTAPVEDGAPDIGDIPVGDTLKEKIVSKIGDLPPMLQVLLKARQVMNEEGSSFKDIGGVLESDPAIAGRVLRLANSAYYGLSGKVSSIQHATVVLGVDTLGEVIAMAGTSSFLGKSLKGYNLIAGDLWQHSLAVALGAKIIANRQYPKLENDAFTAGLFHDAGKIILDPYINKLKDSFQKQMSNGCRSFSEAEIKLLGFDHAEIAAEMCAKWNIPESQSLAIRFHHAPQGCEYDLLTTLVYAANQLDAKGQEADIEGIDASALETLDITIEELAEIQSEVKRSVEEIVATMN